MSELEFNKYHMFWMEVMICGQWITVELPYNKNLSYRLKNNAIKKVDTIHEESAF